MDPCFELGKICASGGGKVGTGSTRINEPPKAKQTEPQTGMGNWEVPTGG